MKTFFVLIYLSLLSQFVSAQNNSKIQNSLLWRITGKGLSRPSYLFGTIHLTDKRVFFLGDSLYNAIGETEGFAAELDLNSMGTQMINYMFHQNEEKNATEPIKVKDVVNAQIWEKYKDRLEKKFDKKADKITLDDLDQSKSELNIELYKKGEMSTFLDAYLFGVAKKQGKWVGGIEDFNDQVEQINSPETEEKIQAALYDEKYYHSSYEWFIKTYISQQLDSIDAFMYNEESGKKDYILIKRNLKMTRRIDSLSAIRSTFFAIGAAHLPGDSGVINLLRSRGFTLTPVFSSKKIDPDKYNLKSKEITWYPVNIKDSTYSLSMPGIANSLDKFEAFGLDMKVFFDLSFMKMYMTMSTEMSEDRKKLGLDSIYNGLKNQFAESNMKVREKEITINGITGREYRINAENGVLLMQVFIPRMERVVLNAVFALREQSLSDNESNKFFETFVYNNNQKKIAPIETKWNLFTNQALAYSVDLPVKPTESRNVRSEEGKIIQTAQAFDLKSQIFYGIKTSSTKEEMRLTSKDSSYFLSIGDDIRERVLDNAETIDSSYIFIDNFPAYRISMRGKVQGESLEIKSLTLIRGNRTYYLFTLFQPGEKERANAEKFLSSFRLLNYKYPEWHTIYSPDHSISTTSPFSFTFRDVDEEDFHQNAKRIIVYDSLSSNTLIIDKTLLPDWFWYSSDTAFLRKRAESYKSEADSISDYKLTLNDSIKSSEFVIIMPGQDRVRKVKIILNGNELYEIFGTMAHYDLDKKYYTFFNYFKILKKLNPVNFTQSRIQNLIKIIRSGDLKTIKEADLWWDNLAFKQTDLPLLQQLSLKIYPDFDTSYYNNLNSKILIKIKELDSNYSTINFIKDNYKLITINNEYAKPLLISWLSDIKTRDSYELIKYLLANYSYNLPKQGYFHYSFYDSLKLTASLFPQILKLADSDALGEILCRLTRTLLTNNYISRKEIIPFESKFISLAKREIEKNKKDIENNGSSYYDLIDILGILNTQSSDLILKQFSNFSDLRIRFKTLVQMLRNKQQVDPRTIYTFASTDEYRSDLYDELLKNKMENKFPKDFMTQKLLGKSKVFIYDDDDHKPAGIIFIDDRTEMFNGKKQKFYLYEVSFSSDFKYISYLGVAGPYSLNPKEYNIGKDDISDIYWDQQFDDKKIDTYFKEFLKQSEEQLKIQNNKKEPTTLIKN